METVPLILLGIAVFLLGIGNVILARRVSKLENDLTKLKISLK
ncbi:hypothetical protein HEMROJRC1_20570 [Rodentibacter sp. JRC1]|nr:hypothetical protein HEMROJRC1_20570 [Rodentibacter sp. JRC1]